MKFLVLSFFILALANTASANDYYCNGQYKRSGSTLYYPNGNYTNSGDTYYYPNGQYTNSGSTRYYPNGQYINSGSTYYYPNGQYINSGSTRYYPNGQYINSGSSCYHENGSYSGSCPPSVKVRSSFDGGRMILNVMFSGEQPIKDLIDYEFINPNITTAFSVSLGSGEVSDLTAFCEETTVPGKAIIDLYNLSTRADQVAARSVICR